MAHQMHPTQIFIEHLLCAKLLAQGAPSIGLWLKTSWLKLAAMLWHFRTFTAFVAEGLVLGMHGRMADL